MLSCVEDMLDGQKGKASKVDLLLLLNRSGCLAVGRVIRQWVVLQLGRAVLRSERALRRDPSN